MLYVVFLLPALFSAVFGTAVMADILQKPDRQLDMWRFASESGGHGTDPISILGIEKQYATSQPITLAVEIHDSEAGCGDLYVTVYSNDGLAVIQRGYFDQCMDQGTSILPLDDEFSEIIDIPGSYRVVAEFSSQAGPHGLVASERFIIEQE